MEISHTIYIFAGALTFNYILNNIITFKSNGLLLTNSVMLKLSIIIFCSFCFYLFTPIIYCEGTRNVNIQEYMNRDTSSPTPNSTNDQFNINVQKDNDSLEQDFNVNVQTNKNVQHSMNKSINSQRNENEQYFDNCSSGLVAR